MKNIIVLFFLGLLAINAQDCTVTLPNNPLTAQGLATPYPITGCNQTNPMMASFVEGGVIDTSSGKLYVYNPLMITAGTTPLVNPTPPNLPANNVVALFFGTNACTLTLADNTNGATLAAAQCVNGAPGSIFGQVSFCNTNNFWTAINTALTNKQITVPPLGNAADGLPCPTVRDFFVVDMDQSDNVVTDYLFVGVQTAQDTAANRANNPTFQVLTNGSDNRLVAVAISGAFGCTALKAPDLADPTNTVGLASQYLNELNALVNQAAPQALVPLSHAMTRVNNQPNLAKTNLYRAGVGQPLAQNNGQADSVAYCTNVYFTAPKRMAANQAVLFNFQSADPNVASNLFGFLAQRFFTTFGPDGLNCASLLNVAPPVVPIKNNMNNLFVGATITVPVPPNNNTTTGLPTSSIIIIVVCSVAGGILLIGLIVGVIWYRNRSMYS
jgi:hypothetical protein